MHFFHIRKNDSLSQSLGDIIKSDFKTAINEKAEIFSGFIDKISETCEINCNEIIRNENIIYVIDLNQLGFTQEEPRLYLEIIANKLGFLNEIWEIATKTDYKGRTGAKGMRKFWMPNGAPSDDKPFAMNRPKCKTVCFLKGLNWVYHHRDGLNHTEGDVLKYFNWIDVEATSEIILNVTKHITIDSNSIDPFSSC